MSTQKEKKLALDWAHGKVTHAEIQRRYKKSSVGAYVKLALVLRDIIKESQTI